MTEEQITIFLQRINKLTVDHKPTFGAMSVNQMVCHCTDQLRVAMGTKVLGDQGAVDPHEIIRLAKEGQPVPTPKGLGQLEGDGTIPTELANDKEVLKNHILDFVNLPNDFNFAPHPYFGKVDKKRWAQLVAYHLNHHLQQFKV
jgi:hypothetical protein